MLIDGRDALAKIERRRRILDWRDKHLVLSEHALLRWIDRMSSVVASEVGFFSYFDVHGLEYKINELERKWIVDGYYDLVKIANRDLRKIIKTNIGLAILSYEEIKLVTWKEIDDVRDVKQILLDKYIGINCDSLIKKYHVEIVSVTDNALKLLEQ